MKKYTELFSQIETLLSELRDAVVDNNSINPIPFSSRNQWVDYIASADVVEDTSLAIGYYVNEVEFDANSNWNGESYLSIYGLMQVIFVQQDAFSYMGKSVLCDEEMKQFESNESYKRLRIARNRYFGHPVKQGGKGNKRWGFVSRVKISKFSFDGLCYSESEGGYESESISIFEDVIAYAELVRDLTRKMLLSVKKRVVTKRSALAGKLDFHSEIRRFDRVKDLLRSNTSDPIKTLDEISSEIKACESGVAEKTNEFNIYFNNMYELSYAAGRVPDELAGVSLEVNSAVEHAKESPSLAASYLKNLTIAVEPLIEFADEWLHNYPKWIEEV
ncbi:MAG: hypothetical protein ACE366_16365 [Bradymonadia bacterium]